MAFNLIIQFQYPRRCAPGRLLYYWAPHIFLESTILHHCIHKVKIDRRRSCRSKFGIFQWTFNHWSQHSIEFIWCVHNGAKICFGVQIIKFIYSEKATKTWCDLPFKDGLISENFPLTLPTFSYLAASKLKRRLRHILGLSLKSWKIMKLPGLEAACWL